MPDSSNVRRVVTAQIGGKGVIVADARVPNIFTVGSGMIIADVWKTHASPAPLPENNQLADGEKLSLTPPSDGTVFRLTDFPPETGEGMDAAAAAEVFASMGASDAASASGESPSALMHRTRTIDYGIVLEGEMTLIMDDQEVTLYPGDVVVQQGANHGWANRSGKLCRMAFVMMDAVESV